MFHLEQDQVTVSYDGREVSYNSEQEVEELSQFLEKVQNFLSQIARKILKHLIPIFSNKFTQKKL